MNRNSKEETNSLLWDVSASERSLGLLGALKSEWHRGALHLLSEKVREGGRKGRNTKVQEEKVLGDADSC